MPKPVYAQTTVTVPAQGDNALGYITLFSATDGKVVVYDTVQAKVISTINVATFPTVVKVSPDGKQVYVGCGNNGGVSSEIDRIDATTNLVTGIFTVAGGISDMCITPDGSRLYVASLDSNMHITEFTLPNHVQTNVISFGGVTSIGGITANNSQLFFAAITSAGTSLIETAAIPLTTSAAVHLFVNLGTIPVPPGIGASPDGRFVSWLNNNTQFLQTYQISGTVSVGHASGSTQMESLFWTQDSQVVYYGDNTTLRWMFIGLPNNVAGSVVPGVDVSSIFGSPDGSKIYLVNNQNGELFPFDTFAHTLGTSVPVGANPSSSSAMPQAIDAIEGVDLVQVTGGQTWNVTVSTETPSSGSGNYTLFSGNRQIGRAVVGQNIGPFTAYDGEQLSIQITGTATDFSVAVTGTSYERGEPYPTVFPGISG